jgi:UDP-N-acetylmuramoylalanine--D-glutamate ligase
VEQYKSALVLGLGASGQAAAQLLCREGTDVVILDESGSNSVAQRAADLESEGAEIILNAVAVPDRMFDICVTSPGIATDSNWITGIESRGIQVISELELGASRCKCPMVAITGSNGKSTLAKLCCDALQASGVAVEVGGNYGTPLCDMCEQSKDLDWVVVEVSSFQLERVKGFRPKAGVLLNVQPDHLDRHETMQEYRAVKCRMFANMGKGDTAIVVEDEVEAARMLAAGDNSWVTFGLGDAVDYQYRASNVQYASGGEFSVKDTVFDNNVMGCAAAAAAAVVQACGSDPTVKGQVAKVFEALPHRMSEIGTVDGVRFVDDSKATNLAAMAAGIRMCDGSVRLVAGGLLKEKDLDSVKEVLAKKVMTVYLIGEAAGRMESAWADVVPCQQCGDIATAVKAAKEDAHKGEVILLSPGCASFDQFKNYGERGDQFCEILSEGR